MEKAAKLMEDDPDSTVLDHLGEGRRNLHAPGSGRDVESRPDREARARPVEDPRKHVPVDGSGHLAAISGEGVEPLEDVRVDVEVLVVAVDCLPTFF